MNTIICQACKKEIVIKEDLFEYHLDESYFENGISKQLILKYIFCRTCYSDATLVISIIRYKTIHKNFNYIIFEDAKIKFSNKNYKLKQEISDLIKLNVNDDLISIKEKEFEENSKIINKIVTLNYEDFDSLYFLYKNL